MSEWITGQRPGYKSKTIQHGSCTITIHRPILTKEEQGRREKQVREALERTMREYIVRKENT